MSLYEDLRGLMSWRDAEINEFSAHTSGAQDLYLGNIMLGFVYEEKGVWYADIALENAPADTFQTVDEAKAFAVKLAIDSILVR